MSTVQNSFSRSFSIIFYISGANPALKLSRQIYLDLVSSPMNISRPEFTLAFTNIHSCSRMGSVPADEIIQYPLELHLYLVICTCNFIRSIRHVFQNLLHINILFGIHPAAAADTVAIRKMESNVSTAYGIPPSSHEIIFRFILRFDEDIQDNNEKLQLRSRITCLSERATDNRGDKSHCGRPRTEHHAPTLHGRLPLL
ncbi:hypothetical protein T05_6433 [Trichinella murrelli]|uniref:Uncharacterized protein n=1 Tax=Trichinella murrelli TaxID=144512 RepID=A0A0V0TFN6_9BILA|nr:hypothetical protein T05_6433 [Trichinella murrelli]